MWMVHPRVSDSEVRRDQGMSHVRTHALEIAINQREAPVISSVRKGVVGRKIIVLGFCYLIWVGSSQS